MTPLKKDTFNFQPFEILVLILVTLITIGYIIYQKTTQIETTIYLEASIQKPDWWLNYDLLPAEILKNIHLNDIDNTETAQVTHVRYFFGESKDWQLNRERAVGIIQLKIDSTKRDNSLFFADQELLIGNPLVLEISNTRLELLISDISYQPFSNQFDHSKVTVRAYAKRPELIAPLHEGLTLKDNNDFTYGTVTKYSRTPAPINTIDQWGNTHATVDRLLYDAIIEIDLLTRTGNDYFIVGYDGRPISIGKQFVLNHPLLNALDTWIVDVQTSE